MNVPHERPEPGNAAEPAASPLIITIDEGRALVSSFCVTVDESDGEPLLVEFPFLP